MRQSVSVFSPHELGSTQFRSHVHGGEEPNSSHYSSALDFKVPELRPYLDQFVRGSNGYSAEQRVKLFAALTADRQYQLLQQVEIVLSRIANDWQVRAGGATSKSR